MSKREIYVNGQIIEVTEEVYRAFMQDEWREQQRNYRAWRCRNENGHRCMKDCTKCAFYINGGTPQGNAVSLDALMDNGFEAVDPSNDVEVLVAQKILHEAFVKAKGQLNDRYKVLFDLVLNGYSNNEIAEEMGVTLKTVKCMKTRLYKNLRVLMADFADDF